MTNLHSGFCSFCLLWLTRNRLFYVIICIFVLSTLFIQWYNFIINKKIWVVWEPVEPPPVSVWHWNIYRVGVCPVSPLYLWCISGLTNTQYRIVAEVNVLKLHFTTNWFGGVRDDGLLLMLLTTLGFGIAHSAQNAESADKTLNESAKRRGVLTGWSVSSLDGDRWRDSLM